MLGWQSSASRRLDSLVKPRLTTWLVILFTACRLAQEQEKEGSCQCWAWTNWQAQKASGRPWKCWRTASPQNKLRQVPSWLLWKGVQIYNSCSKYAAHKYELAAQTMGLHIRDSNMTLKPHSFVQVGMRHFNVRKNQYHCPIVNLDKLWSLVGQEVCC